MRHLRLARLLLCGALAVVWTVSGAFETPPSSADQGQSIGDLEKSIVLIETTWSGFIQIPSGADRSLRPGWTDRVTAHSLCTAFYVTRSGQLVTAGHCVNREVNGRLAVLTAFLNEASLPELLEQAFNDWKVQGADDGSPVDRQVEGIQPNGTPDATLSSATQLTVVDFDKIKYGDVAILSTSSAGNNTPAIPLAASPPKIGDPITSIGFPGELSDVTDPNRLPRASFKTGTVSSTQVGSDGFRVIEVNTDLEHGMSGGPTVDASGAVVGVNSLGLTGSGNFNFVTYTTDLWRILTANGIHPETLTASSSATPTAAIATTTPAPLTVPATTNDSELATSRDSEVKSTAVSSPILIGSSVVAGVIVVLGIIALALNRRRHMNPAHVRGRISFCPDCGAAHPPKERFCRNCGSEIG